MSALLSNLFGSVHWSLSPLQLLALLGLPTLSVLLSLWRNLHMERDLIEGTIRTFLQLFIVGLVLHFVFNANRWWWTALVLAIMVIIASQNAARRGKGFSHLFRSTTIAIGCGTAVTVALLLGLHIISGQPRYLIPVGGMIVGNAMVACGLVLNRYREELIDHRAEIEAWLSLGAPPRIAIQRGLGAALRNGMIPTIDQMKTVGLVTLPGMMTGSILAGADPLAAVELQIMVMLMLTTAVMVTALALGELLLHLSFNAQEQLRVLAS